MLWQLVKFKMKTTFTKSVLISTILIPFFLYLEVPFFMSLSPSTVHYAVSLLTFDTLSPTELYDYAIAGIVYISFIFLMSSFFSPLIIQKSDVDFLFMLSVNEREIVISQIISSFLLNLFSTIFLAYLLFPLISFLSLLIMIMVSILNTFSFFVFKRHKKLLIITITGWILSSIMKFPFSPFSMLFGYRYGYLILGILDIAFILYGIKNVNIEYLTTEFYRRQGILTKEEIPITSVTLYSQSPFIAMLKRSLNFIEIGGRTNVTGMTYVISKRLKIYQVIVITSIIAEIYYIVFTILIRDSFLEKFTVALVGFFITMLVSSSAFINEPLWLDLSTMTPIEYARKYLLSKMVSLFILFIPISIFTTLLNPVTGVITLLIPFISIYISSIYARYYPILQSQFQQFSFRNIVAAYLSTVSLFPVFLDVFFPILGSIVTMIFVLPFLLSKKYWEKSFLESH